MSHILMLETRDNSERAVVAAIEVTRAARDYIDVVSRAAEASRYRYTPAPLVPNEWRAATDFAKARMLFSIANSSKRGSPEQAGFVAAYLTVSCNAVIRMGGVIGHDMAMTVEECMKNANAFVQPGDDPGVVMNDSEMLRWLREDTLNARKNVSGIDMTDAEKAIARTRGVVIGIKSHLEYAFRIATYAMNKSCPFNESGNPVINLENNWTVSNIQLREYIQFSDGPRGAFVIPETDLSENLLELVPHWRLPKDTRGFTGTVEVFDAFRKEHCIDDLATGTFVIHSGGSIHVRDLCRRFGELCALGSTMTMANAILDSTVKCHEQLALDVFSEHGERSTEYNKVQAKLVAIRFIRDSMIEVVSGELTKTQKDARKNLFDAAKKLYQSAYCVEHVKKARLKVYQQHIKDCSLDGNIERVVNEDGEFKDPKYKTVAQVEALVAEFKPVVTFAEKVRARAAEYYHTYNPEPSPSDRDNRKHGLLDADFNTRNAYYEKLASDKAREKICEITGGDMLDDAD